MQGTGPPLRRAEDQEGEEEQEEQEQEEEEEEAEDTGVKQVKTKRRQQGKTWSKKRPRSGRTAAPPEENMKRPALAARERLMRLKELQARERGGNTRALARAACQQVQKAHEARNVRELCRALEQLRGQAQGVDVRLLRETKIGRVMYTLQDHGDSRIARLSTRLVSEWTDLVEKEKL